MPQKESIYISLIQTAVYHSLYQKFACIEHKPDIYIFNGSKLGLKTTEPEFVFDIKTWKNISDESYKHTFLDNANPFNENFCCENKIFRKEFLKSLGDFSIVGLEKQYFFFLTLFNARTIIVNPDAQYYYKDKKTIQKNIFEIFRITDKIKELLNKKIYLNHTNMLFSNISINNLP